MTYWWTGRPEENIWMVIENSWNREDFEEALSLPPNDYQVGKTLAGQNLLTALRERDRIVHYDTSYQAITAVSSVTYKAIWDTDAGLTPGTLDGRRRELYRADERIVGQLASVLVEDFTLLRQTLQLGAIRERAQELKTLQEKMRHEFGAKPLYYPWAWSSDGLRPASLYLAKFPLASLEILPELRPLLDRLPEPIPDDEDDAGEDEENGGTTGSSQTPKRHRKDIAAGVSTTDIDAALDEWREIGGEAFHKKYGTHQAAKYVIVDGNGAVYDAKAILFGARRIAGLKGENGEFDGSQVTVQRPLQALGYVVEDITQADGGSIDVPLRNAEARKKAIEQAREFAGATDSRSWRNVRREQSTLRKALGLDGSSHACAICGRTYPDLLLVAAHIKRRSECTSEEKVDIPAIAMIACTLGCDALFEHGYVIVNDKGVIEATDKATADKHLHEEVMRLHGRNIANFSARTAVYFEWHRNHAARPDAT